MAYQVDMAHEFPLGFSPFSPQELGETWASRNAFAFGRQQKGVQRSQVPDRRTEAMENQGDLSHDDPIIPWWSSGKHTKNIEKTMENHENIKINYFYGQCSIANG